MRILYITQYFVTPDQPGSLRHYAHVTEWAKHGHDVVVLTTYVVHKKTEVSAAYRGKACVTEKIGGCTIRKLYSRPSFSGFRGRMANYLSFMWRALSAGIRESGQFDVVVASSPSLFVGLAGAAVSRWRREPLVLEVRDLWPESAIATGYLSNTLLILLSKWLERLLYNYAAVLIAVTDGIAAALGGYVGDTKPIEVVPNGVDAELFRDPVSPGGEDVHRLLDAIDVPIVAYAGSHGTNNALDQVVDAARLLQNERLHIVVFGQDDQTSRLRAYVHDTGLENVSLAGLLPRRAIPWALSRSSAVLWPVYYEEGNTRLRQLKQGVLPNKLFDYVASGKPIVTSVPVPSEAASRLSQWHASVVYASPSAEGIAEGIREALGRDLMSASDREAFICENSRRRNAAKLETVLRCVVEGSYWQ